MPRRRAEDVVDARREQMLQAAVDVICERGYSETRISDVAAVTGSSPALVIYYFKTKDGLLTEALRYAEDVFYDAVEKELGELTSAAAKLEHLVRVTCTKRIAVERPEAWGLWLDLWAQALRKPDIAELRVQIDRRWSSKIEQVVQEGVATGEFTVADIDNFCVTFGALLDGLSIQVALGDEVVVEERAVQVALRYARDSLAY